MENFKKIAFRSGQFVFNLTRKFDWERFFLIILIVISPFLVFYNLNVNPRSWHDEGAILSVPKTLAEDAVYATRNYGGYQTFGPVQSAGATVVLPIAFVFKTFGVGILQGRVIAGIYALLALWFFYFCGYELFSRRVALLSTFLLLGSPAAGFLLFGRYVLGDIPALSFFLGGCWAWAKRQKTSSFWYLVLSGCLFGAAIVTKTQYLLMILIAAFVLVVLDYVYFRYGILKSLTIIIVISGVWFAAWTGWQILYFGSDVYAANTQKFSELASVTTGFSINTTAQALRFIFGSGSGYFYVYWGIFSVFYILYLCFNSEKQKPVLFFLLIFLLLWIGYFVFWSIPWRPYFIVPGTILSLFVGKLASDLLSEIIRGLEHIYDSPTSIAPFSLLGTIVAVGSLMLFSIYQFQEVVRFDVLDKAGTPTGEFRKPPEFSTPVAMAVFIRDNVKKDDVIETWERELGVLTDNVYHYPDQSMLTYTHASVYRNSSTTYSLGKEYFEKVKPNYVIIGWWGKLTNIYDSQFLRDNAIFVTTIGSDNWGYDVYKLNP